MPLAPEGPRSRFTTRVVLPAAPGATASLLALPGLRLLESPAVSAGQKRRSGPAQPSSLPTGAGMLRGMQDQWQASGHCAQSP